MIESDKKNIFLSENKIINSSKNTDSLKGECWYQMMDRWYSAVIDSPTW